MSRVSLISVAVLLATIATVGPETVETTYWNDAGVGARMLHGGHVTAAEDALRILRSVPLTQLSAAERRHVKRRILTVLGLDHAPRPLVGRLRDGRRAAAVAEYMMALYRGGTDHEDVASTRTSLPHDSWTDVGLLTSDWHQLTAADIVVSFANKGSFIHSFIHHHHHHRHLICQS